MQPIDTLKNMSTDQLWRQRREMDYIRRNAHTPEHVKNAAAVLMNFYGAELDYRAMRKWEGK